MGKNCRNWLVLLAVFIVTVVSFAQADFEQGLAAADRGDYQTAVREWQVCAQTRDVRCQYNLAVAYLRGEGVAKNEKLAVTYLEKAASAGDALAKEKLSELHKQGRIETPPANTRSVQKPVRGAVSQKSPASGTRLLSRTYFQIFVTVLFGTSLLMLYIGLKKKLVVIFDEADAMVLFIGGACSALSFWLWFYRQGFLPKAMSAVVFLFAIGILWESYKTGVSKNKSFVIGTLVFPLRIVFWWLAPV
ncbi:MAG TPA: hypothetical protein PLP17_14625, partial [Oligoflexia bacterium]|nr:hypothetical protein [Oligoflexia bacterium]